MVGRTVFDHFAQVEEGGVVGDAAGLLHIVRDHDHGVMFFEGEGEFFDARGGNRIEGRGRFVHQKDFGAGREGACDAKALLLAAGDTKRGFFEAIFHFVPNGRLAKARFYDFIEIGLFRDAFETRAVGDIVVNAFRERVRLLEYHADLATKHDGIDVAVNVHAREENFAGDAATVDEVIHAVQRAEKCGFPATGRSDERGDAVSFDVEGNVFQRLEIAVVQAHGAAGKADVRINRDTACQCRVSDGDVLDHN